MTKLNIGGIPEHFNMPWQMAIENGDFKTEDIDLIWKDFPGGTGVMSNALKEGNLDIAVVLTEGIIKEITNGNPSKIVQTYSNSPILWGIHVADESSYKSVNDLKDKTAAISKVGSGSQFASIINAKNNNWDIADTKFETVNNLLGGVDALTNGTAAYFIWEHFTAKPLVDNNTFRRIESFQNPWPSYVIAVRNEILDDNSEEIKSVLKVINNQLKRFSTQAKKDRYIDLFSQLYNLEKEDVKNWLIITEWNQGKPISRTLINNVQNKLHELSVIDKVVDVDQLIKKIYI